MQVFSPSLDILKLFILEMFAAAQNRKKFYQNPLFSGRESSRSLILLESSSPLLVIIRGMFVPICYRFHARKANSQ